MRTVRFQPRSFLSDPKLFGKTAETLKWVTVDRTDLMTSSRREVALTQHKIAVLIAKKAPLPVEKATLAKKIGVQPATLGRLLRGEVVMQIETMFLLAREVNHELRLAPPRVEGLEKEREALDAVGDFLQSARRELAKKEIAERKRLSR